MKLFKVVVAVWYDEYSHDTSTHIVVADTEDNATNQLFYGEMNDILFEHMYTEEVKVEGYEIDIKRV